MRASICIPVDKESAGVGFHPLSAASSWSLLYILVDTGGRNGNRLDRSYLRWLIRWVARRAVHEERNGASHEHRPWHRRSRYCQLAVWIDWFAVRPRLVQLCTCRLHRGGHPHLCRALDSTTFLITVRVAADATRALRSIRAR